jgi:hypothetical protein
MRKTKKGTVNPARREYTAERLARFSSDSTADRRAKYAP